MITEETLLTQEIIESFGFDVVTHDFKLSYLIKDKVYVTFNLEKCWDVLKMTTEAIEGPADHYGNVATVGHFKGAYLRATGTYLDEPRE